MHTVLLLTILLSTPDGASATCGETSPLVLRDAVGLSIFFARGDRAEWFQRTVRGSITPLVTTRVRKGVTLESLREFHWLIVYHARVVGLEVFGPDEPGVLAVWRGGPVERYRYVTSEGVLLFDPPLALDACLWDLPRGRALNDLLSPVPLDTAPPIRIDL